MQYAQFYFSRLNTLKSAVRDNANALWGSKENVKFVDNILDIYPMVTKARARNSPIRLTR